MPRPFQYSSSDLLHRCLETLGDTRTPLANGLSADAERVRVHRQRVRRLLARTLLVRSVK